MPKCRFRRGKSKGDSSHQGIHMSQLLPGLHRIKLPLPGTVVENSNAYLVEDAEQGHLLIDTGWNLKGVRKALLGWFGGDHPEISEVSRLVLTHAHMDHVGMAGEVRDLAHCKVFAHPGEAEVMRRRCEKDPADVERLGEYLLLNGVPPEEAPEYMTASEKLIQKEFVPLLPDEPVENGAEFKAGEYCFRAVLTPGHSPGHICLFDAEKKILISGDHILPGMKPNVGLYPGNDGNPLGNYMNSLDIIKDMDAELVLPGHKDPFGDLAGAVRDTKRRARSRAEALLSALATGPGTAFDLAGRLSWRRDKGGLGWSELSPMDKRLALQEIVAHLANLEARGLSHSRREKGLVYHQIAA